MNTPRLVAGALLAAAVTVSAVPAQANEDDVVRRGNCSRSTDWKLKASPENGRIEVEGEIDSNRRGQEWRWRLLHNGSLSGRGVKTTKGTSGSFEVRRVVVDLRGTDYLVFATKNPTSGETCRGVVNF
jgi:hypothetical protein